MSWEVLAAAAGAALVAALNEVRATLRARQADRDRREALASAAAAAASAAAAEMRSCHRTDHPDPPTRKA
jgi:hypothetical protein